MLDACNIRLNIQELFVRSIRALFGCVGALVRFIRAAGLSIRAGVRCFKLRFKLLCAAARASLRHAGRERVARGERHKLAAVGQHCGVTLHSRHEDANPAVSAG